MYFLVHSPMSFNPCIDSGIYHHQQDIEQFNIPFVARPPYSQPLVTTDLFSSLMIFHFQECHINYGWWAQWLGHPPSHQRVVGTCVAV